MNIRSLHSAVSLLLFYESGLLRSFAAEDPARFLSASAWQGTLTRSASDAGSGQYTDGSGFVCDQRWTLNHSSALNVTIPLDGTSQSGPSRIYLTGADATPFSTLDELRSQDCTDGVSRQSRSDGARLSSDFPTPGTVSMLIDTLEGTYTIDFNLPIGYQMTYNGTPLPSYAQASWFWNEAGPDSGLHVTRPLPPSGMAIKGAATNSLADAAKHTCVSISTASAWNDMQGNLVVTWDLSPKTNAVELQVEIKDAATGVNYENWLPAGNLHDPEEPGSSLKFIARLVKPDGTPATETATTMKCILAGVSHEPGVCMNFPIDGGENADFKMLQFSNFPPTTATLWLVDSETSMSTLTPGLDSAEGIVCCYDYGAYATIKVTATVNGQDIIGYRKGDPRKEKAPIRLPKRPADSKVGEAWKKNQGLADDEDSDNVPAGDGHKGDGYSVYEEYRGFAENRVHIRTDPKTKDLFVLDRIGQPESKAGILNFQSKSRIKVHHKLRDDEMIDSHVMNFNSGTAHLHQQNGVLLDGRKSSKGYSRTVRKADRTFISTPASYTGIQVEPRGLRPLLPGTGFSFAVAAFAYGDIAHELGHACSVWHHGDCDPGNKTWSEEEDQGHLTQYETSPKIPIHVLEENGSEPIVSFFMIDRGRGSVLYTPWVARPQGQHSGNVDCIMCYDVAAAIKRDDCGNRYLISTPTSSSSLFCTSDQGTGYNASSWNPFPRFGNANEGRGNCKAQICVNDFYVDDPKHNRKSTCPPLGPDSCATP